MFTIVIVEDETVEREALKIIINKGFDHGVELLEAANGSDAIQLINSVPIDLMLLDINIPYPNGVDVLKHLRSVNTTTKVIVTTAVDDFEIARNMIGLKVDEYLLKPVRPQVLVSHIKSFLSFDAEKYQQTKLIAEQLMTMLDNNLYTKWIQTVRAYVDWIYSQPNDPPQESINELARIIKQVAERRGKYVELLKKQIEQLKSLSFSQQNYYKVLSMVLTVSNTLFDEAQRQIGQTHDPMQKAFNYIERNLGKHLSLEEVAEKAHVTPSYLSRLFKKDAGINFVSYVKKRRIDIAKSLLDHSDMSISNVAMELSYNDPNYFGRTFKEETGLTPSEYKIRLKA